MTCILQLIAMYNAQGFTVLKFCTDSEPIRLSLATPLDLLHTSITHTTPDSHCHKAERHIQEIDKKVIINLKNYVADCINLTSQSDS